MHICFLDIDGTLVLTGGAGQTAFAHTLAEDFGIPAIDRDVTFAGRSDQAIATDLFRAHGIEPSAENWQRFRTGYLNAARRSTRHHHRATCCPASMELLATLASTAATWPSAC